jgi:hypothetical protein
MRARAARSSWIGRASSRDEHDPNRLLRRACGNRCLGNFGCLAAKGKRIDLFGALVLGLVTAFGGGTVRDLLVGDTPVAWLRGPAHLLSATITTLTTFVVARFIVFPQRALLLADAFALALFVVVGTRKGLNLNLSAPVTVLLGSSRVSLEEFSAMFSPGKCRWSSDLRSISMLPLLLWARAFACSSHHSGESRQRCFLAPRSCLHCDSWRCAGKSRSQCCKSADENSPCPLDFSIISATNSPRSVERAPTKQERFIGSPQGTRIRLSDGRDVLNLCANNYLGLAQHPDVKAAGTRRAGAMGIRSCERPFHLWYAGASQEARIGAEFVPPYRGHDSLLIMFRRQRRLVRDASWCRGRGHFR